MKIAICGSLDFSHEMKRLADDLQTQGFTVELPPTAKKILDGETSVEQIKDEKARGTFSKRAIKFDAIRRYWLIIQTADAVLIANYDKRGIASYIGGNSFLEMGFAHVLHKPIFLLNDIPEQSYIDEIQAMQPTVLHGDVTKLKLV